MITKPSKKINIDGKLNKNKQYPLTPQKSFNQRSINMSKGAKI